MERRRKVLELRSKLKIKIAEINLKELELADIKKELLEAEWVRFTWQQLENWLKENRPKSKYRDNPMVKSLDGYHISHCRLNEEGELQIGPYFHHDNFPRGKDLRVAYDFRPWQRNP